jgi:hypothetical protein
MGFGANTLACRDWRRLYHSDSKGYWLPFRLFAPAVNDCYHFLIGGRGS